MNEVQCHRLHGRDSLPEIRGIASPDSFKEKILFTKMITDEEPLLKTLKMFIEHCSILKLFAKVRDSGNQKLKHRSVLEKSTGRFFRKDLKLPNWKNSNYETYS